MYSLSELFEKVNSVEYRTVGQEVDYCFVKEENTLYIYFEPSNGGKDWKHNFMFKKRPYKDMKIPYKVHRGFLECWKTVEDIILARIADPTIKEIVIVGYSHGGALSALCHECCWYNRPDIRNNIWGIGFDSPRVYGSFTVDNKLKERWAQYIVIRNHNDLVTHVPPALFGYCHVGTVVKVGEKPHPGLIKAHYPEEILYSLQNFNYNTNWKEICVK